MTTPSSRFSDYSFIRQWVRTKQLEPLQAYAQKYGLVSNPFMKDAIHAQDGAVFDLLLQHLDVHPGSNWDLGLSDACRVGWTLATSKLLDVVPDYLRDPSLSTAAGYGHLDCMRLVMDKGVNPSAYTSAMEDVLSGMYHNTHLEVEVVGLLMERGKDMIYWPTVAETVVLSDPKPEVVETILCHTNARGLTELMVRAVNRHKPYILDLIYEHNMVEAGNISDEDLQLVPDEHVEFWQRQHAAQQHILMQHELHDNGLGEVVKRGVRKL